MLKKSMKINDKLLCDDQQPILKQSIENPVSDKLGDNCQPDNARDHLFPLLMLCQISEDLPGSPADLKMKQSAFVRQNRAFESA